MVIDFFCIPTASFEAADAKDEFLGRQRLASLVVRTAALSTSEAADTIMAEVRNWSPTQDDDLTVIVCDFLDSQIKTSEGVRLTAGWQLSPPFSADGVWIAAIPD